ncbi:hypothetical protein [Mesorhizobium loti]|uniref:hypothetical protein n=1 Tax=Rhizobium loti TaxID=381 RepID=UPI00047CA9DA|nr:hypothetical protein [Mesorhizobium loti]
MVVGGHEIPARLHLPCRRSTIAGYVGKSSALERLVLYSGSHGGEVIEDASFGELEEELALIDANPDEYVREFAGHLRILIGMA